MQYYQTRLACVHYKLQCLNAEYAFHTETLPSLNMLSSLVVTIPVSELWMSHTFQIWETDEENQVSSDKCSVALGWSDPTKIYIILRLENILLYQNKRFEMLVYYLDLPSNNQ